MQCIYESIHYNADFFLGFNMLQLQSASIFFINKYIVFNILIHKHFFLSIFIDSVSFPFANKMASLRTVYAMTLLLTLLLTSAPSVWAEICFDCNEGSVRCYDSCFTKLNECRSTTRFLPECIRASSMCYRSCDELWDPCYICFDVDRIRVIDNSSTNV